MDLKEYSHWTNPFMKIGGLVKASRQIRRKLDGFKSHAIEVGSNARTQNPTSVAPSYEPSNLSLLLDWRENAYE